MAMQTFSRLYDSHDDAVHIVQALEQAGIPHSDVSLVASNVDARQGADGASGTGLTSGDPEKGAGTGGGTGATLIELGLTWEWGSKGPTSATGREIRRAVTCHRRISFDQWGQRSWLMPQCWRR